MGRTAASLVVANEILSGRIQDGNTQLLAKELRALGIELRRIVVVPDQVDAIADEVNALRATVDFVFTSGGIGPTHDDRTMIALGRAFNRALVRSATVERLIRAWYGSRCTEAHLRMADLVEGMELVTRPSIDSWPAFRLENVFVFPGVPELYATKLSIVRHRLEANGAPFSSSSVYARGDEGELKPWIDEIVQSFPDVTVGSYPKFGDEDFGVRVIFESRDRARVRQAVAAFVELLPSPLLVRHDSIDGEAG